MAHEIGPIIGGRHKRNTDRIMTLFPYGHGYVNGTKCRGIMSYKNDCGGRHDEGPEAHNPFKRQRQHADRLGWPLSFGQRRFTFELGPERSTFAGSRVRLLPVLRTLPRPAGLPYRPLTL